MKKIITLLLGVSIVATGFAQTKSDEVKDVILGKKKSGTNNGGGTTSGGGSPRDIILGGGGQNGSTTPYPTYPAGSTRDEQINQVNRDYNAKVASIRNNPTLTEAEKERAIRQLESDRQRRIREINRRFDGNRDRDGRDDRDEDDDRYEKKKSKGNNGNHYGWEKGKGNPHRTGAPAKGNSSKGNKGNKGKGNRD